MRRHLAHIRHDAYITGHALRIGCGGNRRDTMSKSYEVTNSKSGQSFGFHCGVSAEDAIRACCREAGYLTVSAAEEVMGRASELTATRVVTVPANGDEDDCLQAAADLYASQNGLTGWDLAPRWEDGFLRDTIILSIPDNA
jgi:hypothetical protein